MTLDNDQISKVINYLNRYGSAMCAVCRHDEWRISGTMFQLPEYAAPPSGYFPDEQGRLVWRAPEVFPVIPVVCKTCGNMLLISAVAAGVVPSVHQATVT